MRIYGGFKIYNQFAGYRFGLFEKRFHKGTLRTLTKSPIWDFQFISTPIFHSFFESSARNSN
jgi:hypothetical protein